jgi:hypothetical protein
LAAPDVFSRKDERKPMITNRDGRAAPSLSFNRLSALIVAILISLPPSLASAAAGVDAWVEQ